MTPEYAAFLRRVQEDYYGNQAPRVVGSSLAQRGPLPLVAVNSRFADVAQETVSACLVLWFVIAVLSP